MNHTEAVAAAQRALDARGGGLRASTSPEDSSIDGDRYVIGYDGPVIGEPAMVVDSDGCVEFVPMPP